MAHGERRAGGRLGASLAHHLGGGVELHRLEVGGDALGLRHGSLEGLLGVYGLEHLGDPLALAPRHLAEHVAVEVDGAAPVLGLREHLLERAEHAERFVAGHHADAREPAPAQPQQELLPRVLGLGEALGAADHLAVAVAVHADGDHDRHVLVGAAPAALEARAVDEHVGVLALERPVPPLLDRGEGLVVEVGDGAGRHAGAPQYLADILDAPGGHAGEAHLDDGLLDAGLAPAVSLDHRGLERGAAQLRHVELHLARRRDELSLAVARAVRLAPCRALVAPGVHQFVGLLLEELVDDVAHGVFDELLDVEAQRLLVY